MNFIIIIYINNIFILDFFRLIITKSSILVGGQAVIEGVMMRVPGAYATAVRDSKGKIHFSRYNFKSITEIYPFFKKIPININI